MKFIDLRQFVHHLEASGELVRIQEPVSPDQEIPIIHHHVIRRGGPALLFENVIGSDYPLVTNLYGTRKRTRLACGGQPEALGAKLAGIVKDLIPPTAGRLWSRRKEIGMLLKARQRRVTRGPILDVQQAPPDLTRLPCLKCWPRDAGSFFTLPVVRTADPETGAGNLGIYRMQRYDAVRAGMHWQIEKGGGFHFQKAREKGISLPVTVILGGPPALALAAIAPLPEGIDEWLLAALMTGKPIEVIHRGVSGHKIPARAEFVLEGRVSPVDLKLEGPFGDHFGHYSHAAMFPVFQADRLLARKGAIYPATVVGKPCQEDFFIGEALQELSIPLLKIAHPGIDDLWAYGQTGFHPLAVAGVRERYPQEALKQAFAILGDGQLSLTKVLIMVSGDVSVRDFSRVSDAVWEQLDAHDGLFLLAPTAQDTLDFTGPAMNLGSRLILLATARPEKAGRQTPPPPPPRPHEVHENIDRMRPLGKGFLIVRLKNGQDPAPAVKALARHGVTRRYLFHVLLSPDVPLDEPDLVLWGWFTRFDPLKDMHPARHEQIGNRLVMHFPIAIDATWKKGYPPAVAFAPEREKMVLDKWARYGI